MTVGRSTNSRICCWLWPQRLVFGSPIKWGSLDMFSTRFQVGFQASFFYLLGFFSTCFRANTSISKGEFSRGFFKRDFLSFSPTTLSSFSHTYLSFSLPYLSYRSFVVRVFIGDQSVEITKCSFYIWGGELAGSCLWRVLVGARCRGAASTS